MGENFECSIVVFCVFFGVEDDRFLACILLVEVDWTKRFVGLPVNLLAISLSSQKA